MFRNYFRISFRNLKSHKGYALINILGLSIGIAVSLLIFLVIGFETSFDNFHKKQDRIFRVLTEYHHADSKNIFYGHGVPYALPEGLKSSFRQIEEIAPVFAEYNDQFVINDNENSSPKKFKEERGVFFTGPSFFRIFDFPLLAGTYESLNDPNNVLLSRQTADKYYGDWKNAVGKTLKLNNTHTLKVSGILADAPANTDFQLKVVIAYGTAYTADFIHSTSWDGTNSSFGCFILLPRQVSEAGFNGLLKSYSKKVKSPGNNDIQTIQALQAVHFDTQSGSYGNRSISQSLINALWLIAGFILLIACVNFTNLSTAQAVNRSKEVGIRKVLGSNKWQLKIQFLSETFLIVLASIVIAISIAQILLPYINQVLDLSLKINGARFLSSLLFLAVILITVTLLAGFYPSIVLSGYNPIIALKSKRTAKATRGITLRRGLVVFQFVIAQALIIATLVITRQMIFFNNQSLGFDKNALVNIPVPADSGSNAKLEYLKKELKTLSGIHAVSFNSNTPVEDNNDNWTNFRFDHATKQTEFYSIIKVADNEYVPSYKLPLIAGRNLQPSDTIKEFLVNELLLRNLGITDPQKAINREIRFSEKTSGPIVGVLKDFNTRSFRDDLAPLIITTSKRDYTQASIKMDANGLTASMQAIENIWAKTFPEFVFEYKFMDEKVESFYKKENQLARLFRIFAVIAIFLSCLGLYGLASFMAVQRIKEVGIRKVLGATGAAIVYLFSREFILLIAVAFFIATPLTWYFMNKWLQNYPFRIELSIWIFLTGGLASIIIALSTVSFQAIKAASANPVKSLRSE